MQKMTHDTPEEVAARLSEVRRKPNRGQNALALAGLLLIFVGIVGGFGYAAVSIWGSRSPAPPAPTGLAAADPGMIEVSCEDAVRGRLKAPATAKFTPVRRAVWGGESWAYSGAVDSQNGFGALLRTGFACKVNGQTEQAARVSVTLE